MKTTLRYLSLNAQSNWHRQVEKQLKLQLSAMSGRWTHAQAGQGA
jgi:hypothetical protein